MAITHVLISRPEAECADLAQRLKSTGLEAIEAPAFEFIPREFEIPDDSWRRAPVRLAVFTSPRAVEFALPALPDDFLDRTSVAALGPATAAALQRAGASVDVLPEGGFTSEALLGTPWLARTPGEASVFAAPGGRRALAEGLSELGWRVREVFVYERRPLRAPPAAVEAIRKAQSLASVWTSQSAMDGLLGALADDVRRRVLDGPFVVVSDRLALHARELGARRVLVAPGPGNRKLAACVAELAA